MKKFLIVLCVMHATLFSADKINLASPKSPRLARERKDTINGAMVTVDNLEKFSDPLPKKLEKAVNHFLKKYPDFFNFVVQQNVDTKKMIQDSDVQKKLQNIQSNHLPKDIEKTVRLLYEKNTIKDPLVIKKKIEETKKIAKQDLKDPNNFLVRTVSRLVSTARALESMKIKNISEGSTIIVSIPKTDYLARISNPLSRAYLQTAAKNLRRDTYGLLQVQNPEPTYQTSSFIYYFKRLQEFLNKKPVIEIPANAYIYKHDKGGPIDDSNAMVIVEKFPGALQKFVDLPAKQKEAILNKKTVKEFIDAIVYAGLWSLSKDNVLYSPEAKKIVLFDLEQPDTTKPSQMFNHDKEYMIKDNKRTTQYRAQHNIAYGLQQFLDLLPKNSTAYKNAIAYIRSLPDIQSKDNGKTHYYYLLKDRLA